MTYQLKYDASYLPWLSFSDSVLDRHISKYVAEITLNWGRLEYGLYLMLEAIDPDQAAVWTRELFTPINLDTKKAIVLKQVLKTIKNYPEFYTILERAFEELDTLRNKRNVLAHGLSKLISEGTYEIQPLKFSKKEKALENTIQVDIKGISELMNLMKGVREKLANLEVEIIASRELEKIEQRKLAARTKTRIISR